MRTFFYLALLIFSISTFAQGKKCVDFKNGTFKYTDKDYGDLITVRLDTLQTDTYPESNEVIKSRINWLSDCKYEMEVIEVNKEFLKSLIGTKYTIEIITINGNKIVCRSKNQGTVVEKEMIKVAS